MRIRLPEIVVRVVALAVISVATSLGATEAFAQNTSTNARSPLVSPDGRHIAFVYAGQGAPGHYVMNADGTGLTRVSESAGSLVWAADGARLLYTRTVADTTRVYSLAPTGGPMQPLGAVVLKDTRSATVTSDGSRVVLGAGSWTATQLYVAALNGVPTQITSGNEPNWCARLSPDDRRIAVGRRGGSGQIQVWVMNIDGTAARQVTHFPQGDPQCPSWSADGTKLAVQGAMRVPDDTTKTIGSVWIIDLANDVATLVGQHSQPYLDELPVWFPDSKRLAFQSDRTGRWEVWTINVDGTGAQQLTR